VAFYAKDLSFTIPQRKKLNLYIVGNMSIGYVFQGRNPASEEVEFSAPAQSFTHILRLPVPEKAQKQYNFCMLRPDGEPILFNVSDAPLSLYSIMDPNAKLMGKEGESVLETVLNDIMQKQGVKVTHPKEAEFVGAVPESHRKSEKAYHVKAFRGSKDGSKHQPGAIELY
jgi:hypothetical protein